jgi:hypothetical protein
MTEVLEDSAKKTRRAYPVSFMFHYQLFAAVDSIRRHSVVENCRTLSKSVDTVAICRRMSYHSRNLLQTPSGDVTLLQPPKAALRC